MRSLSKTEYDELLARSEIIQKDRSGIKVIRQPDGNFLKTFWCRHRISLRRLYPEWLRFILHAKALTRCGIPTVEVLEAVRIPHLKRTAVIYHPLEGRTLRQVAAAGEFSRELAGQLGEFVAGLHRQGILFRSLHLGNVLLCPDGTLGLIDISDMKWFPWPLSAQTRRRNFIHLFRYTNDLKVLAGVGIHDFADGYFGARASPTLKKLLNDVLRRYVAENSTR